MCFRPATVGQSINCPMCDKKVNAVLGAMPTECPFCEADLSEIAAPINEAIGLPNIAPAAPNVPSAPKAPGASK